MRIQEQLTCLTLLVTASVCGCEKANSGGAGAGSGGTSATGTDSATGGNTGAQVTGSGGSLTGSGGSGTALASGGSTVTISTGGSTPALGGTGGSGNGGATMATSGGSDSGTGGAAVVAAGGTGVMSFFVTSDKSVTGDLGGLVGADARCQRLATAAGFGAGVWHAYLSAEQDPANANMLTNARDRIGTGPWYNKNGLLVANNLDALHARKGNPDLFVDEQGARINGQWVGSPTPNEHDVLTGSTAAGAVMTGFTCQSWTSSSSSLTAQVGHADGLGPSVNPNPPYDSWNSSHANGSCADTAPKGGAGRLYCFLVN